MLSIIKENKVSFLNNNHLANETKQQHIWGKVLNKEDDVFSFLLFKIGLLDKLQKYNIVRRIHQTQE